MIFVRPIRFAAATWMGVNHALAKTLAAESPDAALTGFARALVVGIGLGCVGNPDPADGIAHVGLCGGARNHGIGQRVFRICPGAASLDTALPGRRRRQPNPLRPSPLIGLRRSAQRPVRRQSKSQKNQKSKIPPPPTPFRPPPYSRPPHAPATQWNRRRRRYSSEAPGGTALQLNTNTYQFRDAEGRLIDSGPPADEAANSHVTPVEMLREFLRHRTLPPSPQRGWPHQLEEVAATMEALVVSHRTGQAESPEKFMRLRR